MKDRSDKNLSDLPPSDDLEFWGEGQRFSHKPKPIKICKGHKGKEWMNISGYVDNHDGTVSCKWCPWGTILPGYLKVLNERIVDLRSLIRKP